MKYNSFLKQFKNFKMTPKLAITGSLAVIVVVGVAIIGITKYNNQKVATATLLQEEKKKEELQNRTKTDTASIASDNTGANQSAAGESTPAASGATTTPSSKPSAQATPTSPAPTTGNASPASGVQSPASTSPDSGDTPQVTLTYPSTWKQTVSGTINITANASDSSGINRVVFMIRKIGVAAAVYTFSDTTAPYSASFDTRTLPNGDSNYTVEAQTFDNVGGSNLASLRINIQN